MTATIPRQFNHTSLTAWNLLFQYAQSAFLIVYGVVLTPLYLRSIPETTFGVWLATGNLVAWLSLVDPGLNAVVQQRIAAAYARGDTRGVSRLRTHCYVLSILLALAIAAIGLAAAPWVSRFVTRLACERPGDVMTAYYWACVATGAMTAAYGTAVVNIGMQAPIAAGAIYLLSQICSLMTVLGFLHAGAGVVSIPLGLLSQAIVLIVGHVSYSAWRFTREAIPACLSLAGTMTILRDSRGTIMSRLAGALTANTDMLVAAAFLGPSQAVAANMTQKGPGLLRTFIDRVSHSAMPSLSAIHSGGDPDRSGRSASLLLRGVIWLAIPAAVGVMLFNRTFVGLWVGRQHYAGDVATAIIALTVVAMGLEVTLSNLATAFGLFQANGRMQLIKSVLSGLFSVLFAWSLGLRGLLAAPLVAGACTTWWLLPRLMSQACGWSWGDWVPVAGDTARVVVSAAAAAGLAAMVLRDDIVSFLVAGGVYVSACLALMAVAVPPFQTALRRVASAVARRIRPRFIGGRVL
jgi:O-antigen/teichoic acid export membrane protein